MPLQSAVSSAAALAPMQPPYGQQSFPMPGQMPVYAPASYAAYGMGMAMPQPYAGGVYGQPQRLEYRTLGVPYGSQSYSQGFSAYQGAPQPMMASSYPGVMTSSAPTPTPTPAPTPAPSMGTPRTLPVYSAPKPAPAPQPEPQKTLLPSSTVALLSDPGSAPKPFESDSPAPVTTRSGALAQSVAASTAKKAEVLPIDRNGNTEPIIFAILGILSLALLFPPLGFALCITALLMRSAEESRGLFNAHSGAVKVLAILGILLNIALLAVEILFIMVLTMAPDLLPDFLL